MHVFSLSHCKPSTCQDPSQPKRPKNAYMLLVFSHTVVNSAFLCTCAAVGGKGCGCKTTEMKSQLNCLMDVNRRRQRLDNHTGQLKEATLSSDEGR